MRKLITAIVLTGFPLAFFAVVFAQQSEKTTGLAGQMNTTENSLKAGNINNGYSDNDYSDKGGQMGKDLSADILNAAPKDGAGSSNIQGSPNDLYSAANESETAQRLDTEGLNNNKGKEIQP
jgi:hypothetical protein